jgi:putative tricarboxylic transport membrane protein
VLNKSTDVSENPQDSGLRIRTAEVAVALLLAAIGGIVIKDSLRLGMGWSSDGPQSGYFPFYVGLALLVCSAVVFFQTLSRWSASTAVFATASQLGLVARMFVPIMLFVLALLFVGVYVAAAVYIASFMRWQGKFRRLLCIAVGLLTSLLLFCLFELWFHVPLPKGPLEEWFGY